MSARGRRRSSTAIGTCSDVESILASSDLAVLSSDNEGTPISLIQAAAAGLPSISTAVGGVAEVVPPGCGEVVPVGDHRALAEQLTRLASDSEARHQMGARARAHVRVRFSANRLLTDVEQLYDELLAKRP